MNTSYKIYIFVYIYINICIQICVYVYIYIYICVPIFIYVISYWVFSKLDRPNFPFHNGVPEFQIHQPLR